jgi:N-methylhydantoinase A
MTQYALAIDIGGTFTDVVLIAGDGRAWTDKTLTTHHDLLEGFFRAASAVADRAQIALSDIDDVVAHATTVVTNALIERKGPPTALLTTRGFGDVLYLRNEHRYDMFDPQIEYPEPLIPRSLTWEHDERTYADGSTAGAPSNEDLEAIAAAMKEKHVESVAVCLLNSYRNPAHEKQVAAVFARVAPEIEVSLSSDVAPQMREYLRTSTTVLNAYTLPITKPYLAALTRKLDESGVRQEPLIMLSNGGVVGAKVAGSYPVRMIESGPAAGALVAGYYARRHGYDNLMSFDMGGTTAKACLIQDGQPLVVGEFEVDRRYRFKPGSGMPITVPSIDMIEIGAGGGSIARVDDLGLLKVGPDSAGSEPGPACYGRGGQDACVTDADVVLGILDASGFLGGDMALDKAAATAAVERLASALKVPVEQAAFGIFSVVAESMAAAARAHATDRGVNYRGMPLLAFGGAGPVHACFVAERLDSSKVIYPPMASVLSAFGTLVTPVRLDLARSAMLTLDTFDPALVEPVIGEMLAEGEHALTDAGISRDQIQYSYSADMRYRGQQNEVNVELAGNPCDGVDEGELRQRFEAAYKTLYGVQLDDMGVEVVSWRVTARGADKEREAVLALPEKPGQPKASRPVYFQSDFMDVPVYDRSSLAADQHIDGPVIVEERETTVFILPGWRLEVHGDGSLIATRDRA